VDSSKEKQFDVAFRSLCTLIDADFGDRIDFSSFAKEFPIAACLFYLEFEHLDFERSLPVSDVREGFESLEDAIPRIMNLKEKMESLMADSGSTFPEQLEIMSHSGSYPKMNGIYKFAAGETFNGLPVWRKDGGWVIKFTEQNNGLCWNVLQKSYTRARLKEAVAHPALATKPWEIYSVIGWSLKRDFTVKVAEDASLSKKQMDEESRTPQAGETGMQELLDKYYAEREQREAAESELQKMTKLYKKSLEKISLLENTIAEEQEKQKLLKTAQAKSINLMKSIQDSLQADVSTALNRQHSTENPNPMESDSEREERVKLEKRESFRHQGIQDKELQHLLGTLQRKLDTNISNIMTKNREKQTALNDMTLKNEKNQTALDRTQKDLSIFQQEAKKLKQETEQLKEQGEVYLDEIGKLRMQITELEKEKSIAIEQKYALLKTCSEEIQRLNKLVPTMTTNSVTTSLTYLLPSWL